MCWLMYHVVKYAAQPNLFERATADAMEVVPVLYGTVDSLRVSSLAAVSTVCTSFRLEVQSTFDRRRWLVWLSEGVEEERDVDMMEMTTNVTSTSAYGHMTSHSTVRNAMTSSQVQYAAANMDFEAMFARLRIPDSATDPAQLTAVMEELGVSEAEDLSYLDYDDLCLLAGTLKKVHRARFMAGMKIASK